MRDPRIERFLADLVASDGSVPLSDAKIGGLGQRDRVVVIEEGDEIVAIGVTAVHRHGDGTQHWAVETAVVPGLRFAAFEDRLVGEALSLVPRGEAHSVWSRRRSLDAALERAGFAAARELAHYVVGLPLSFPRARIRVRPYQPGDAQALLEVNRDAFAGHREAESLDADELARLMGEEWFDPAGLLIAEEGGDMVAFCWTRVDENGDGEIYRIAVSLMWQGRGLGRSLVLAGFEYLSQHPDVLRGTLWVDLANAPGVSLYESLGMTQDSVNREFLKLTPDT
ncbi:MAG: GNAT family N-acetyltransferase [Actinomycetota bacterium]|nr:GNAT family N-acetyltransferase [Actinomycetota bacterium]MDK1016762.1 GNAT family N-acetyltransferase [Actinomycetota bacterium]MDK1026388.1 GNAT family N-acetyltransferase [Actinomycetota bacterium]MDK1038830.1 GNAT family N-acetyltransferase [Actinomycetota bacterium]MDK1097191.1 GNAT family N-acetyltransferase [Actinomycetota bacterium]